MSFIRVVGEDALCCALGERLVAEALPGWELSGQSINTRGISKLLPNLQRYAEQAEHVQPVLCVADTDNQCPIEILNRWMPERRSERFLFRLAVTEAESWILADRRGTAEFFGIAQGRIPSRPEAHADAKQAVLRLARQSSKRQLRQEMVSQLNINRPGSGYNLHLVNLVANQWEPARAVGQSDSLQRALTRVAALARHV